MTTLAEFLPQHLQQHALPDQLGGVLQSVVDACVQINRQVRLGALAGVLGEAGSGKGLRAALRKEGIREVFGKKL